MRATILGCLSVMAAMVSAPASAEVLNLRNQCDTWEHVPGSEALKSPTTAMLTCTREDTSRWLALRVECHVDPVRMVVRYRTGFAYQPPEPVIPTTTEEVSAEEAADIEAAKLVAAIPYDDGGVKVVSEEDLAAGKEMIFLDFQSFGYTAIAGFDRASGDWEFAEENPLSPIFSRMIVGNYADFKLLSTGKTERFPLRGSGKALRPVVETCRKAKRAAELAGN